MTLPEIDYESLSDEELAQVSYNVTVEQGRRNDLAAIPNQMASLNAQYLDASGTEPGQAWVQPTGAHDAYPKNWVVSHEDQNWVSLVDANVWEPGVANWRSDSGEEFPQWVQPTGAHDAYDLGAKVTHTSMHWISSVNDNVWEPGVPGSETLWSVAT